MLYLTVMQAPFRSLLLQCLCCIALLFMTHTSLAQLPDVGQDWFLSFVNAKHTDTCRLCTIRFTKDGDSYQLSYPGRRNEYLPPEGLYKMSGSQLQSKDVTLYRKGVALLYYVGDSYYEFRSVKIDSLGAYYMSLSGDNIDKGKQDSAHKEQYVRAGMKYAQKVLAWDDRCTECHYNLCVCMLELNKLDSAAFYYHKASDIYPEYDKLPALSSAICGMYISAAWHNYGEKGNYSGAIRMLKKALLVDANNADVLYNLGGALFSNKQYKEAVDAFRKALVTNPNYKEAKDGLDAALQMLHK